MHVLREGKEAFLEFLRNLTPQALLLGIALVAGRKLTFACCYPENLKQTIVAYGFGFIGLLAAWSSVSLFIEKYFVTADPMARVLRLLKVKGVSGFRLARALLKYAFNKKKLLFFEAIFVVFVVEFGISAVFFVAITNATGILKLMT